MIKAFKSLSYDGKGVGSIRVVSGKEGYYFAFSFFFTLGCQIGPKCNKYKYHQNILSINEKMREKGQPKFSFHFVT